MLFIIDTSIVHFLAWSYFYVDKWFILLLLFSFTRLLLIYPQILTRNRSLRKRQHAKKSKRYQATYQFYFLIYWAITSGSLLASQFGFLLIALAVVWSRAAVLLTSVWEYPKTFIWITCFLGLFLLWIYSLDFMRDIFR